MNMCNKNISIKFISFTKLTKEELLQILKWRNSDNIRQEMTHQNIISQDEHLNFCQKLKDRKDCIMCRIDWNNEPYGVITVSKIDNLKHSAEIGTYFIKHDLNIPAICMVYAGYLYQKLKLKEINFYTKKSNVKAVMFNLLKQGGKIIKEDEEYIFFRKDLDYSKLPNAGYKIIVDL